MRTNSQPDQRRRVTVGGRARRDQIERAASEVLAEVGYAAASVARIAERAGVSKGVITYHFTSKGEILTSVALRVFEGCAAYIAAGSAGAVTPAERLRAEISAELDFFSSHRVEFLAMSEVMANHRDAGFVRTFTDVSATEIGALAELLVQGQAQGQFRQFDAGEFAHAISAAKYDVLERWAAEECFDLAAASATLWDFVEGAVTARPIPGQPEVARRPRR